MESTFLIFFAGRPREPTEDGAKFTQSPEFALVLEGRGEIGVGAWSHVLNRITVPDDSEQVIIDRGQLFMPGYLGLLESLFSRLSESCTNTPHSPFPSDPKLPSPFPPGLIQRA